MKTSNLIKKYPLISAYSEIMGSYQYWNEMQLNLCAEYNAPVDTYRIDNSGKYHVLSDMKNEALKADLIALSQKYK